MNIRELLAFIDQTRPNAYTDEEKIHWLNIIEGRVYREIFQKAVEVTNRLYETRLTSRIYRKGEEKTMTLYNNR